MHCLLVDIGLAYYRDEVGNNEGNAAGLAVNKAVGC